jgi:uncharacterized membrane protein HdeD (DUF308 family)
MLDSYSRNWWIWVLRGVFAILFGLLAIVVPDVTLTVLVLFFGAYVLIDGGMNLYAALTDRDAHEHWWIGLLEGIFGIIAGILTFIWPGITALILLIVIAVWAIMTGVMEIWAAIQLRRELSNEVLLGITGLLSIIFGVLMLIWPASGALAVIWLIGIYALLFGGMLIALGLKLRSGGEPVLSTS